MLWWRKNKRGSWFEFNLMRVRTEVLRFKDGVLHVRIAASPIKGKANQELIKFLSDILGISKRHLIIEKGMTGKSKVIRIGKSTQNQVMAQLARLGK